MEGPFGVAPAAVGGYVGGAVEGRGLQRRQRLAAARQKEVVTRAVVAAGEVTVGGEDEDSSRALGVDDACECGALGREPAPVIGARCRDAPEESRADPDDELARGVRQEVFEPRALSRAEHALGGVVGRALLTRGRALVGDDEATATDVEGVIERAPG